MGAGTDAVSSDAFVSETPAEDEQDRGFVAVWMAIVLFVLIGVAAFAVDLVHAYVVGQQVQNAADAAALAGAEQIPADIGCPGPPTPGHAYTAAQTLANQNLSKDGISTIGPNTTFTASCTGPNEMTVHVKTKVDTWFARALGFSTLTVNRSAVAQYDGPLDMGSPANNLGDVPGDSCTDLGYPAGSPPSCASVSANANQNLWAQIQGPETTKTSGNAYTTDYCNGTTDGCSTTGMGGNTQFSGPGGEGVEYFYVHNDLPGQPLMISVYDAGFVDTGGFCDPSTHNIDPTSLTYPSRYALNSPYCAGDERQVGLNPTGSNPMDVEFQILGPDNTPDPSDNPVVCTTGDIPGQEPLNSDPLLGGSPDGIDPSVKKWFEQWQPICPAFASDGTLTDYEVRVITTTGQGTDQFALLATHGLGKPILPNGDLAISAKERLPLFASKPTGGPGEFYLARVTPSDQPRTLSLSFFDLGDSQPPPTCGGVGQPPCPASTGTLDIYPDGGSDFSGCQTITGPTPIIGYGKNTPNGPPWGDLGPPGGQPCSFTYDKTSWNGQWVTISVPIPTSYNCNGNDPNDFQSCWVKIKITPGSGVLPLSDATTWNATISGAPVRLVG
jgi:hypothetical protein